MVSLADDQANTLRVQPWAQSAILLVSAILFATASILGNSFSAAPVIISFAVLIAGTIVVFWLDRSGTQREVRWFAIVPLADIVATAVLAAPLSQELQVASAVVILPLVWLALAFDPISIVIGVILSASVPLSRALATDQWPERAVEWLPFVLAPVVMSVFAVSAHGVGRALRANQRATEQSLRRLREESRARAADVATMAAIEDGTDDAVVVFDRFGALLRINEKGRRLAEKAGLDFRAPGFGAHRVFAADRLTPRTFPPEAVREAIEGAMTIEHVAWLGAEGDQIAVHYRMFPIRTDGEVVGAALIAHDVTELLEAIEVRDRFLDAVGHELRTPLTALIGETELALMGAAPAAVAERLASIDDAASRLLTAIERLVAAGREAVSMMRDATNVAILTGDVVAAHRQRAEDHGVRLRVRDRRVAYANVDTRSYRTILSEIIVNALRFTPAGGDVVVTTDVVDAVGPVVEVHDTGVGMSETERRRAFDRFYRTAYARAHSIPGAGLGLSIAKKLADQSGILIELRPGVGGGTWVRLVLPAAEPEQMAAFAPVGRPG